MRAQDPNPHFRARPKADILHWEAELQGPSESPFAGGTHVTQRIGCMRHVQPMCGRYIPAVDLLARYVSIQAADSKVRVQDLSPQRQVRIRVVMHVV